MGRIATHAAMVCVYARYCYCLAEKHSTSEETGVVQSVPPALWCFFYVKWAESIRYSAQAKHSPSLSTAFPRISPPRPERPHRSVCVFVPGASRQKGHAVPFIQQSGVRNKGAGLFVCNTPPHDCLIPDTLSTVLKQDLCGDRKSLYDQMSIQASGCTRRSGSPHQKLAIASPAQSPRYA